MEKKINWKKTLNEWKFSEYAKVVSDQKEIDKILQLLNFASSDSGFNVKLTPFQTKPDKRIEKLFDLLEDDMPLDRIVKNAYSQLKEHRKIARTHLEKEIYNFLTYEIPFVLVIKDEIKYCKFQFSNKKKS